jgi:uncharacterized SAM-binding protein YcdF (DUF218 family)
MADLDWLVRTTGKALLLPPGGPLVLAVIGMLVARRWRRIGASFVALGIAALYILAMPLVSAWLVQKASNRAAPVDVESARKAQAIVILGGGVRRDAPDYGGDTLGRLSLERVRYGARLARETGLPVIVSGGSVRGDTPPEAQLMREALEREFSVPVRWTEATSRNTRENAKRSAEMLRSEGIEGIVLVVHAFDVPRAREEFERWGLRVIPAPTLLPSFGQIRLEDFLPSAAALLDSHYAAYELIAQSWPFLRA